jgi:hypothetical protein
LLGSSAALPLMAASHPCFAAAAAGEFVLPPLELDVEVAAGVELLAAVELELDVEVLIVAVELELELDAGVVAAGVELELGVDVLCLLLLLLLPHPVTTRLPATTSISNTMARAFIYGPSGRK